MAGQAAGLPIGARGSARPGCGRGQALVFFALLIPVVLLFFLFALGLAAAYDVRAHASYALGVATRAGARQVQYAGCAEGDTLFHAEVAERTKDIFREGLELRALGLADTPANIAEQAEVAVGYGSPDAPWPSPFTAGHGHVFPTVAARARVPVRVWVFEMTLWIVSETEVR